MSRLLIYVISALVASNIAIMGLVIYKKSQLLDLKKDLNIEIVKSERAKAEYRTKIKNLQFELASSNKKYKVLMNKPMSVINCTYKEAYDKLRAELRIANKKLNERNITTNAYIYDDCLLPSGTFFF